GSCRPSGAGGSSCRSPTGRSAPSSAPARWSGWLGVARRFRRSASTRQSARAWPPPALAPGCRPRYAPGRSRTRLADSRKAAMPSTRYAQPSRHLARQAGGPLWPWLLGLTASRVRFDRLLPAQLTVPGFPERVTDLVAALADLEQGG